MASISKHNLSTRIATLTGHTHELIDEQLDHVTKLEDRLNQHSDNSYPHYSATSAVEFIISSTRTC